MLDEPPLMVSTLSSVGPTFNSLALFFA